MAYPAVLWLSVLAALFGSFQFGYHLGVLNTCLEWMAADLGFSVARGGSVVVSAALIGAALGSLGAGQFADSVGPGRAMAVNNLSLLVGSLLYAVCPGGIWAAVVGRFLAGLGAGAASLYVPRYLAEIAPASIRGGVATLNQVFICLGILIAYVLGLPYAKNRAVHLRIGGHAVAWWRVMVAAGVLPALTQMLALSALPESPVWLRWRGRSADAAAARRRLLGRHPAAAEELAGESAEALVPQEEGGRAQAPEKGWGELLGRRYRRIMLLTTLMPLLQQFSGINTCILYSSEVFKRAGLATPVLGSILMGCINICGTLTAAALMDRAGRRLLLLLSYAGMGACLLAISLASFVPGAQAAQTQVAFVALLAFVLFFSLGCGPIPWIYLPEILPNDIKGRAASLGTSLNWVATFLVGLTFPAMLAGLGVAGAYLLYAAFNFGALALFWAYMVETKRRPLEDIQRQLLQRDA